MPVIREIVTKPKWYKILIAIKGILITAVE
jgi:hypothetical protein